MNSSGSCAPVAARNPAATAAFFRSPLRRPWPALALALTLALAGCGSKEAEPPPPRPVVAMPAKADAALPAWTLPGEVQARYSTPLSFRVGGKIIERKVRLGDTVKPGQVVAKLDPADATKNAAAARAQLSAAQHQLDYAKQQLDRDRAQAKENLIAANQLEQTRNAYASALAQRDQAAQQAALSADQLNYTTLAADHAGVITAEQADTGQNVAPGHRVLMTITRKVKGGSSDCARREYDSTPNSVTSVIRKITRGWCRRAQADRLNLPSSWRCAAFWFSGTGALMMRSPRGAAAAPRGPSRLPTRRARPARPRARRPARLASG